MNPHRQPLPLRVERVEWIPSSPDEIEVRLYGTWNGPSVPPEVSLVVGDDVFAPLADPPPPGKPPAWSAAYRVPVDARAPIEEGRAAIAGPDFALPLPEGGPGALDGPAGTVVDPAVLAERRARKAEESAERRAVSAEQTVETLRAQLAHLEERAARAGAERDALAGRVTDAEQRLRSAEQREAAERARREELEEEVGSTRTGADSELASLRARLAAAGDDADAEREALRARLTAAEEAAGARERELEEARARVEEASRAAAAERAERLAAQEAASRAAAEADGLRAEVEALRAELDAVRAEAESSRARAGVAEDLRARIAELERRLVAQPQPRGGETESLRARVAELDRQLAEEREARAAAEERLTASAQVPGPSERERALVAQVAALEGELARRAQVQHRVQEAIGLIRDELGAVREQVEQAEPARAAETAAVAGLRAELVEMDERARTLDAAVRSQAAELEAARSELAQARTEAATARAEADRRRAEAEGAERGAAEARRLAKELAERLAVEEAARAVAEERLAAAAAAAAPLDPDAPSTGDPALDTLITGLRAQVAAAREQLARWGVPEGEEAAPAAPPETAGPPDPPRTAPASARDFPALDEPLPPKGGGPAAPPPAAEATSPSPETPPAPEAPPTPAEAPPTGAPEPAEDETRRRLQAIAAELRAAVPAESGAGGHDVIGDLQRAAERLRAAAEQELERLERPGGAGEAQPLDEPVAEQLGARPVYGVPESAWLRTGLERLAQREPATAARLFAALLPAQALVADDVTYDVTAPASGTLRVIIASGVARVEPRDAPGARDEVDVAVEGPLDVLAPLAAGGTGRRLKGAEVRGSRRRLRRLLKARRRPVTLGDLGLAGAPVHPGLLLAALAAAVEPAWTRGHRAAVVYEIEGDGTFSVVAADGRPLRVVQGKPPATADAPPLAATVVVGASAFMPLLAGQAPPAGARASVLGDRQAVDALHSWFDAARGVGVG